MHITSSRPIKINSSCFHPILRTGLPRRSELSAERRGSTSSFYGFDPQSNSRILVSIGGNITDSCLYKAFDEELAVSGTTANPLRFGGQVGYWRDLADRLYVRARH